MLAMIFWSFCRAKSTRALLLPARQPARSWTPGHPHAGHPDVVTFAQAEHVGELRGVLGGVTGHLALQRRVTSQVITMVITRKIARPIACFRIFMT